MKYYHNRRRSGCRYYYASGIDVTLTFPGNMCRNGVIEFTDKV